MTKIIAIAGGSCSGKTTLAKKVQQRLGDKRSQILYQDSFYIDQSEHFDFDGGSVNFDHPEALDFQLMHSTIQKLKASETVEVPIYDFSTHKRKSEVEYFSQKDVLIVDGTLILSQELLRSVFDQSYFIECDYSIRLQRRLHRDVKERGRSQSGVLQQFTEQVEPMHKEFVEPSKQYAKTIYSQDQVMQKEFLDDLLALWWP